MTEHEPISEAAYTSMRIQMAMYQDRIAALEAALARVQIAWDELGRCTDEFMPEYPEACSEYQSRLDDAISALLATRAGADADG